MTMSPTPVAGKTPVVALILAGGTGGHVYPALAVAQMLRQIGWDVHWLGSRGGMEARVVPEAGFPIHEIRVSGVRGKGLVRRLFAPWMVLNALWDCAVFIRRLRPAVVLGMGGFTAGPAGLATWLLRRPLVIHEQNAYPGLTNRLLAPLAQTVLEAFPGSFARAGKPSMSNLSFTGNPLRREIAATEHVLNEAFHGPLRVLVLGGSQGAQTINQRLPETVRLIQQRYGEEAVQVTHQAGPRHGVSTKVRYANTSGVRVVDYIDDMAHAYADADLAICRSGAMTVAELTAVGVPSILIPFPFAVDDHQRLNAQHLSERDAAVLMDEADATPQRLADELGRFLDDPGRLVSMACAAHALGIRDATQRVVARCEESSRA
ncbi:MAG: UDP-N-acetylglucosamine--N-acetylmuramyl-(pentapeptide) pyrophosphoryl-undecaprenol N-acetylglucosamine transferase [Gammaproteobacteria bacterium]|jgi:UDP-N-acetylglucosamine--N-acetylmuramyl-(pentapeptide) pyrophosphoryl-undecaprenol N-acetylglucosamine transferase